MAELFKQGTKLFIPFALLGYPDEHSSLEIVKSLVEGGADMLELGFPFSDPIADGPVLQAANSQAIAQGITVEKCFDLLRRIRSFSALPIGLLLYANIVYQYGIEKFYAQCKQFSVTTVLVADVPLEESEPFCEAAQASGIGTVFMVCELTTPERLEAIIKKTTGFLYVVSKPGVTGARKELAPSLVLLLKTLRAKTHLALFVGFGISTPAQVTGVCEAGADGAICGSAITQLINAHSDDKLTMLGELRKFSLSMKEATRIGARTKT